MTTTEIRLDGDGELAAFKLVTRVVSGIGPLLIMVFTRLLHEWMPSTFMAFSFGQSYLLSLLLSVISVVMYAPREGKR